MSTSVTPARRTTHSKGCLSLFIKASYALDDSFHIPVQLCLTPLQVIVGANGSGKSTILKLATRLYDVTSGQILIDGHDIRTLKLSDLRQVVSVLFQDYTHFPLSVGSIPFMRFVYLETI